MCLLSRNFLSDADITKKKRVLDIFLTNLCTYRGSNLVYDSCTQNPVDPLPPYEQQFTVPTGDSALVDSLDYR